MRLLIVYNMAGEGPENQDPDRISEIAVVEEAQAVFEAANQLGLESKILAVSGIPDTMQVIEAYNPEVIFNLCEGFQGIAGHEMHMAALWELLGVAYTGNSPLTLGLAQDKILTKRLMEAKNIHTPPYQVFERIPDRVMLEFPLIAKPSREDASLGIGANAVSCSLPELQENIGFLLKKFRQPVLVERYIYGREFNISLIEAPLRVLAISEIDFSALPVDEPAITSYEAKWMPEHPMYQKTPARCPASITAELKKRLEDVGIQIFKLMRARDYGRLDVRVDSQEHIYALEFNPNPDISKDAGFSKAIRAAGMTYSGFVNQMVKNAVDRKNSHD